MIEKVYELNAKIGSVSVQLMDGRPDAPRICIAYTTKNGHSFWFLPVNDRVVRGLCRIGEVWELNKLVGKTVIIVKSHQRLHGFKHPVDSSKTLLEKELWGEQWKDRAA